MITCSTWCPERPYVQIRIPKGIIVRRLDFRFVSHDQGFSDQEAEHGGTYRQSYTWFEAAVVSPSGHERVPRRRILNNVHASSDFRQHDVSWDFEEGKNSAEWFDRVHRTPLQIWIGVIRAGDTIQVIPKAHYPGWINFVQEVQIRWSGFETEGAPPRMAANLLTNVANGAIYQPLNRSSQDIRLLLLESGHLEDPISCSLRYVSLDRDEVKYEALSYCWGDPTNTMTIKLSTPNSNSQKRPELAAFNIQVTSTIHAALRSLRRDDGQSRQLWVDAICINQEDLRERSSQVGMMRDVYARAETVIVWLGDSDEGMQKSFQTIKDISHRYEQLHPDADLSETLRERHSSLFEHDGVTNFVNECPIFDYPWFRRTWVLQEVANAKRSLVHVGRDSIPWSSVLRLNHCIDRSQYQAHIGRKFLMLPLFSGLFQLEDPRISSGAAIDTNSLQHSPPRRRKILDVIISGLDLDATDPRDKIFALLQFGDDTNSPDRLSPEIKPDYEKDVSQVFSDFTRWWIVTYQSLRILSTVHVSRGRTWQTTTMRKPASRIHDHPSWCLWHDGESDWAKATLGFAEDTPYHASGPETLPRLDLISNPGQDWAVLKVMGRRLCTIEGISSFPYYNPNHIDQELFKAYETIFDPISEHGSWTHGVRLRSQKPAYTREDIYVNNMNHLRAHIENARRAARAAQSIAIDCHNDCLFIASEGNIGLCPQMAVGGDVVVLLYGGSVPYLLREMKPSGEGIPQWELVGECYLHGYMDGKAVKEQQEQGLQAELFHLI